MTFSGTCENFSNFGTPSSGSGTPTSGCQDLIVWTDVETSGTTLSADAFLEVGALVSDTHGRRFGTSYESLITVSDLSGIIEKSSDNVRRMHERSGLWMDLWIRRTRSPSVVDSEMAVWLSQLLSSYEVRNSPVRNVYFGGNSITLDRRFIQGYLPSFYSLISYRSVDVTSLSIALQSNTGVSRYEKCVRHRALSDASDSLDEYRHYLSFLSGHLGSGVPENV